MDGTHILVVDADRHSRLALSLILKKAGFRVTIVPDENEALAVFRQRRNDAARVECLVLHRTTHGPSPVELWNEVLRAQIPVLLISGCDGETEVPTNTKGSRFVRLEKPFDAKDLLVSTAIALQSPDLQEQGPRQAATDGQRGTPSACRQPLAGAPSPSFLPKPAPGDRTMNGASIPAGAGNGPKPGEVSRLLHSIQRMVGYVSIDALKEVAEATGGSLVDIYGHATLDRTLLLRAGDPETRNDAETSAGSSVSDVRCSWCNHSLIDRSHLIDGEPSCRVNVAFEFEHGSLWLSTVVGSGAMECEYELPSDGQMDFFCPHCSSQIIETANCERCGAPLVPVVAKNARMAAACSRCGCALSLLPCLEGSRQVSRNRWER